VSDYRAEHVLDPKGCELMVIVGLLESALVNEDMSTVAII
jgi:hypothetical protein